MGNKIIFSLVTVTILVVIFIVIYLAPLYKIDKIVPIEKAKLAAETFCMEDKIIYDSALCQNSIYVPSYNLNDEVEYYIFTFYRNEKPVFDSIERKELYEKLKNVREDIRNAGINKLPQTDINKLRSDLSEFGNSLSGVDDYAYVMIGGNYRHMPFISGSRGLPSYFAYDLLDEAKKILGSNNVQIERIYSGLIGGIVKYKSGEGKIIYLGYDYNSAIKQYTEIEFTELKERYNTNKISLSKKIKIEKSWGQLR